MATDDCGVCLDGMTEPKAFGCGHIVCGPCFGKVDGCPFCRHGKPPVDPTPCGRTLYQCTFCKKDVPSTSLLSHVSVVPSAFGTIYTPSFVLCQECQTKDIPLSFRFDDTILPLDAPIFEGKLEEDGAPQSFICERCVRSTSRSPLCLQCSTLKTHKAIRSSSSNLTLSIPPRRVTVDCALMRISRFDEAFFVIYDQAEKLQKVNEWVEGSIETVFKSVCSSSKHLQFHPAFLPLRRRVGCEDDGAMGISVKLPHQCSIIRDTLKGMPVGTPCKITFRLHDAWCIGPISMTGPLISIEKLIIKDDDEFFEREI